MKNVGPYSCLYYVVVMTFGNYILQNLLVALIMEGYKEVTRHTNLQTIIYTKQTNKTKQNDHTDKEQHTKKTKPKESIDSQQKNDKIRKYHEKN